MRCRFNLCLFFLLTLSSCNKFLQSHVELHEIASISKHGSGRFKIVVDLSKLKRLIAIEKFTTLNKISYTQSLVKKAFQTTGRRLKTISGISKLSITHDQAMFCFKLSFHFNSIKSLNRAMHSIYADVDDAHLTYFKMDSHSFVRIDTQSIVGLLTYYQVYDDSAIESFGMNNFFNNVTYTTTYFFDRRIKKFTNKLAKISKNRKVIKLFSPVFAESLQDLSISNKIFF